MTLPVSKGFTVSPSLSFVLPVHNGESHLAIDVSILLDTLVELTPSFEILIIDDGSQDDTMAAANELARKFPQVRAIRQPLRYGMRVITQSALKHTFGDLVIVQDVDVEPSLQEIRDIWQLRNDQQMVMVQPPSDGTLAGSGLKMLRREVIERLSTIREPEQHLSVERVRLDQRSTNCRAPQFLVRLKRGASI